MRHFSDLPWQQGLYILGAWVGENRFCISHEEVEGKSNEIKAIPEVLSDIDIKDAGVSIDAMGTRREIADLILGKEEHYLPAVKGNQKSLHEDIECAFKVNGGVESDTTTEKDHGRIETRKCSILSAEEYLMPETLQSWKGLAAIIRMESTREVKKQTSSGTRYYISDGKGFKASYCQSLIRGHWSVENRSH